MTPRERVVMAFTHHESDRVPCWCGGSHDYTLEKTPVESMVAMFDAVAEFGVYPVKG